jgi:Fe-S-cluster containining protein
VTDIGVQLQQHRKGSWLYNHPMRFTCQPGCTRCCTQKGWVYLSVEDVPRLAAYLGIGEDELQRRYLYSTRNTRRLRMKQGQCPFLTAEGCSVHPAKPTQCRLFPFWPELIEDKKELKATAQWCPGLGKGDLVPVEVLEASAKEMRSAYPQAY